MKKLGLKAEGLKAEGWLSDWPEQELPRYETRINKALSPPKPAGEKNDRGGRLLVAGDRLDAFSHCQRAAVAAVQPLGVQVRRASAKQLRQLRVTAEIAAGLRVESRARSEAEARHCQLVIGKQVSSHAARRFPQDREEGTKSPVPLCFII